MFGKNLLKQLLRYLLYLCPFLIAVVAMSALARYIVLNDTNPYEMTGTLAGIALFVMAALAFVISVLAFTYISFYKQFRSINFEDMQSFKQFYWVQLVAFVIYIAFIALIILAGVASFAWEAVGQMFSEFPTEWPYFLEFLFYFIITVFTLFLIPTTWITLFRFKRQIKLPVKRSLAAGIITLYLYFVSIILEIFLLAWHNDPLIDWPFLLGMFVTCIAVITLVDIRAYLLTCRTIKTTLHDTQIDK